MRSLSSLRLLVLALVAAVSDSGAAELSEILQRARAFVGAEAALEGLRSVHFSGVLETTEITPEGPRPIRARIEIRFQKPFRQRIELVMEGREEITALDDYEGWQRLSLNGEAEKARLTLLGKDQIRRLRANTWENLAFYRGLDAIGGRIEDRGTGEQDGRRVRRVAFIHGPAIAFVRTFDEQTGQLLLTETERQGLIREEGELWAGGIRFPAKIITVNKLPDGSSREVVVAFERIVVNEDFPDALFAVPPVRAR